jgi:spore maturation protein CgeB
MVRDGAETTRTLGQLKRDTELRVSLARRGLETIRARHTCAHRVDELLNIMERLGAPVLESAA